MRLLNWVKFATSTTGTSDIAVGAADSGFITPAQAGAANGDRFPYVIDDGTDWAYGIGTYSTSGPTLARDTDEVRVMSGTKTTAKLSLSGSAKVYFDVGEGVLLTRPDVLSQASATSLTPDITNYEVFRFTALAANLTINAPSGTPYDGQEVGFEFVDDDTDRTLTWNAAWKAGFAAPPTSTGGNSVYQKSVTFRYNASRAKWNCITSDTENAVYSAIEYVGGGVSHSLNAQGAQMRSISLTGLTGGIASTAVEGDIVIAAVMLATDVNGDQTVSMNSAGYTKIDERYVADTIDTNFALFYKVMGASPDTTAVCNGSGSFSDGVAFAVQVYRGVDPNNVLDVAFQQATGTNSADVNPPSITPTTAGARIVAAGAGNSTATYTQGGDLTNFITDAASGGDAAAIGMGNKHWTSGVFDTAAWSTAGDSTSSSWTSIVIALRPKLLN